PCQNRLEPSRKVDVLLRVESKFTSACPNERYRPGICNDGTEAFSQPPNVVHVLDRDAIVALRKLLRVRKLANDLRGPDKARPAHRVTARLGGVGESDRKTLHQTQNAHPPEKKSRSPPMRKERDLQDAIEEAEFDHARAEISLYGRPAMREHDQPDIQS